jgi:putative transposase
MARQRRLDLPNVPQHVVQRGNDRMPCFFDDDDRRLYLELVARMSSRYGCAVHAYVLMTNHVHLLVTHQQAGAVSRMMQGIGRLYVAEFNRRHARTGTLWEGRYKSNLVDSERYVLACYRYIELNPLRAAMVAHPADYIWSSYRVNANGEPSVFVRGHAAYLALGASADVRLSAYRALFNVAADAAELSAIRAHLQQQRVLGSRGFQSIIEHKLGRCAALRPAHRPPRKGGDVDPEKAL